jgi:hypothetical protein
MLVNPKPGSMVKNTGAVLGEPPLRYHNENG